jgi:hypothetical protein
MIASEFTEIEQKKVQLISLITQIYDIDIIEDIEALLLNKKKDWWNMISDAEKQAIDKGLEDVQQGRLVTNEQVINEVNERYKDI